MSIFFIKYLLNASGNRQRDTKRTYEYIPYQMSLKSLRKQTRRSEEDL